MALRRILALLILIIVIAGVLIALGWWLIESPELYGSARLRDWQTITFTTDQSSRSDITGFTTNWNGAGIIRGIGQFFGSRLTSSTEQGPIGVLEFAAQGVEVTILDLAQIQYSFVYVSENGNLFARLESTQTIESQMIEFESPLFLNNTIAVPAQAIVYQSAEPENFHLFSPSQDRETAYTEISWLTSSRSRWGWSLRQNCTMSLERAYTITTAAKNFLNISETCAEDRGFLELYKQDIEKEHLLEFVSNDYLLMPVGYDIVVDGRSEPLRSRRAEYIILLSGESSEFLYAFSTDLHISMGVLLSNEFEDDQLSTPLYVQPSTRQINLRGPVGRFSIGLEEAETTEISNVTINYADLPNLEIENELTVSENGTLQPIQILSTAGTLQSLYINHESMIRNRWQNIPAEIQGNIVGAFFGALVSILIFRFERKSKESAPAETLNSSPVVQPTPVFVKSVQQTNIVWAILLITLTTLTVLWRKISR